MVLASIVVLLTGLEMFYGLFLLVGDSKIEVLKKGSAVFRGFFTLFLCFNPYSIRGKQSAKYPINDLR